MSGAGEVLMVSAINSAIAVEVIHKNKPRIIGGKLAADATLSRGKEPCELADFKVGEQVEIRWKMAGRHKEIVAIAGDDPAPDQASARISVATESKQAPKIGKPETATTTERQFALTPTTEMIGPERYHVVGNKETLLDIARRYDLGYNEIRDMYPDLDPWVPAAGSRLLMPTQRILPDGRRQGIVINVPEMRLYYYRGSGQKAEVISHPVGIGDTDFQTEPGKYTIGNKAIDPTWYIPASLRQKYQVTSIPPGPDNPLGKYWLGLKNTSYGIHGSDIPWSVGRKVTHGCIRMYPEDISELFKIVPVGTPVEIVYEPVKIAKIGADLYIEVHNDIYSTQPDLAAYARERIDEKGLWLEVDKRKFEKAIERRRGIPEKISFGS
ncbi:MAG: L,D-transpeptidase family protein [Desulfopila sp.]